MDVVVIENCRRLREMLIDVLLGVDDIDVVAHAEDEKTALSLMESHQPHVVIVDLDLSGGSGIGLLTALNNDRGRYSDAKAVVFTNHNSVALRRRCESLGIDGYFDKSYHLDDLIDYIRSERDALAR
ncbi:MAG: response regulator [Thiogranum sp.]|nr:response regulator [Thiogranum sp.]